MRPCILDAMKIVILHDDVPPDARPDELDVYVQVEAVAGALRTLGHEPVAMPLTLNLLDGRERLRRLRPDMVFNLVEALGGQGRLIHLAPALVESLGIPLAGASSAAMFVTSSKTVCKQMLAHAGIDTPGWVSAEYRAAFIPGRYIIKSVWEEASVGLSDDSIVNASTTDDLLREMGDRVGALGGEAFAEQYIDGREFNLSVLAGPNGPEVLPPAEIDFVDYAPDKPRIVSYAAKWDEQSFEYHHTPRRFDFPPEDRALLNRLSAMARRAWIALGLHGWARVDFRVDSAGRPLVLEVNANPCLSPDAGFAAAVHRAGLSFEQAVARVLADPAQPARANRATEKARYAAIS